MRKAFTLVEALVATTLAAVGVVAALNGMSSIGKAQALSQERERMLMIGKSKLDEFVALGEYQDQGGSFDEWGESRYIWEAQIETTGTTNLSEVIFTVRRRDSENDEKRMVTLYTLVYEELESTTAAGGTP
ncbi:MAG: hypothetical protein JST40_11615 [Armatimonadetes bacterium]|nr:hypothetical protein [Armatimonadota bacterium]